MGGKTEAQVTKVILVVRLGLEPSFLSREELHSRQHTTTQRKSSIVYRRAVLHQ